MDDSFYADVYKNMKSKMASKMQELNDNFEPMSWYRDNWIDENRNIIKSARGNF